MAETAIKTFEVRPKYVTPQEYLATLDVDVVDSHLRIFTNPYHIDLAVNGDTIEARVTVEKLFVADVQIKPSATPQVVVTRFNGNAERLHTLETIVIPKLLPAHTELKEIKD